MPHLMLKFVQTSIMKSYNLTEIILLFIQVIDMK